jgi:hypothetical protein
MATMLQDALHSHAANGEEGLCITVIRKGKIFGVIVDPGWFDGLKKHGFKAFVAQYLEPAFCQLEAEGDEQDKQ